MGNSFLKRLLILILIRINKPKAVNKATGYKGANMENEENKENKVVINNVEIDVNEIVENNKKLVDRLNFLEKEAQKAFSKRDELKSKLREFEEKQENSSNKSDAEANPNLETKLQEIATEKEQIVEEFNTFKRDSALERALLTKDIPAATPKTKEIILNILREGAEYENGIVYKDEGGIVYGPNGNPLTIEDKLKEIQNDENYSPLFRTMKPGAGSKQGNGGKAIPDIKNLKPSAKAKLIKELGSEKYLELVKKQMN